MVGTFANCSILYDVRGVRIVRVSRFFRTGQTLQKTILNSPRQIKPTTVP